MKLSSVSVACLAVVVTSSAALGGTYSGGAGSAQDPYRIGTVADWQELMNTAADWGGCFILTADLDFQDGALIPVGSASRPFTGDFNGNALILRNGFIDQPNNDYVGLFGFVGSGGRVRRLGLEAFSIMGRHCVGGLVGYNQGTVSRCYAAGTVAGDDDVGGWWDQAMLVRSATVTRHVLSQAVIMSAGYWAVMVAR